MTILRATEDGDDPPASWALSDQRANYSARSHRAFRLARRAGCVRLPLPAGGFRRPAEAAILKSIGTLAGVPDILAIHRGRVFALEIKTATGRVTDTQRVVHDRMRRAGAEVGVAYGLDEALATLEGWKLLLRGRPIWAACANFFSAPLRAPR
jgi:hypothetical protein